MKEQIAIFWVTLRYNIKSRIDAIYSAARNKVWLALFKYTYDDRALYSAVVKNQKVYDKHTKAMNPNRACVNIKTPDIAIGVIDQLKPLRKIVGVQPMLHPVDKAHLLRMQKLEDNMLSLNIVREVVEAKTRKLAAKLPHDATKQDRANLSIAIADELTTHALNGLRAIAQEETIDVLGTPAEVAQRIILRLSAAANQIARDTRRGAGNAVVLTNSLFERISPYIEETVTFTPADSSLESSTSLKHIGTIFGMMELFVDENCDDGRETALIGYKGVSDIDAGYVFSPYVLVMGSGEVTDGHTTMTRFGDTTDDAGNLFFRELTFNF